jgi:hypothetical protein
MLARTWSYAFSMVVLSCSAAGGSTGGQGYGGSGSGSGGASSQCAPGNCHICASCFDKCLCATGDAQTCVAACGGGAGGVPGAGGTPGAGGVPGAGGTGNAPGVGGSGAVPGAGGAGGAPVACQYPAGPYGNTPGTVIAPNMTWQGFKDGSAQAGPISIQDYYDCDGTKGINAILIISAAQWCGNCQQEASELNQHMGGDWGAIGIRVLTLMVEDLYSNPAGLPTAQAWQSRFGAQAWSVAADPGFFFAKNGTNGLPINVVVNPRNMQILERTDGYSPYHPKLEQVAQENSY